MSLVMSSGCSYMSQKARDDGSGSWMAGPGAGVSTRDRSTEDDAGMQVDGRTHVGPRAGNDDVAIDPQHPGQHHGWR